jgi:hypothetical protein
LKDHLPETVGKTASGLQSGKDLEDREEAHYLVEAIVEPMVI